MSKEVTYDDLSIEEFTAGYCAILKSEHLSELERTACISHLHNLMYLAMYYEWTAIRRFHAAILLEIEGAIFGGRILSCKLDAICFMSKLMGSTKLKATSSNPMVFCCDYQCNKCSHNRDHFGSLRGTIKWLQHICDHFFVAD